MGLKIDLGFLVNYTRSTQSVLYKTWEVWENWLAASSFY